jgi:hypothetical protein
MFEPSAGRVSVQGKDVDVVGDVCRSVECGSSEPALQAGALLLSVLLTLGLVATFRYMAEARSLVAEERERTATERDAFTQFERKVSGIEATKSIPVNGSAVAIAAGTADRQLEQVQSAYRETVMSVPHYETEYDESIEVNMTAELGEEVAAAVFDGTRFTQQLKRGLISQSNEARRRRSELLTTLDREEQRLTEASEELSEIESTLEAETPESIHDCSFPELSDRWDRLGSIENRCQNLLEEHSTTRGKPPEEQPEFREFVYHSLPTEYPVLSDGTRLLDRIMECRRTVMRALTRRA